MKKWSKILSIAAGIGLFVSCLAILGTGAVPPDWDYAGKIRCYYLSIGTDDTPTTLTETEAAYLWDVTSGTVTAYKAVVVGQYKNIDTLAIAQNGLKLGADAGTTVTATAAELNFNDGSIAGTAVASKTLVLGADKNIDTLDITKDGLEIGGSAVTVTAAEANFNDGSIVGTAVANKTLVLGANKEMNTAVVSGKAVVGGTTTPKAKLELQGGTPYSTIASGTSGVALDLTYNAYSDDGITWKRIFADVDASLLTLQATGNIEKYVNSDANATADSAITWTEATLKLSKDKLSIDGTTVTLTAAEANYLDTSTPGTAVASKALVLGANKNVDTLVIADSGLKLGADAGTAVTSTATELNLLDGSVAGTAVASKAAVLGASKDLDYLAITGTSGADLEVAGEIYAEGMVYAIASYSTNQDIGTTHTFVSANTNSTTVTLTLPDRASSNNGRVYFFKKIHASNTLIIDGYGGDTIDGAANVSATADDAYLQIIGADTDGWMIIGNKDFS